MIYLIGGSPSSGKSILSKQLSKKLNIPYLSTDNIRPIVLAYLKGEERAKKFPLISV
jgi:adenylate kinase family enzyme